MQDTYLISTKNFHIIYTYVHATLLKEPHKSVLANAIWNLLTQDSSEIPNKVQFVLDDGSLLQHIPWK